MCAGQVAMRSKHSFSKDQSGNVAMMWALMGAVLVGLLGLTVDFTRAQAIRAQMQNAADGAALVAERSANLTLAERQAAARAFFDAEMGDLADDVTTFNVTAIPTGGHLVSVNMPMPVTLARIVRNEDWDLQVDASAEASASPPIEVALVLDNTGSMANDMDDLREIAGNFANDLMSIGGSVEMALVPFVAQVNIGNQASHLAWMDQAGTAPMNGEILEDRMIGYVARNVSGTVSSNALYTGPNCASLSTLPYTDNPATTGASNNEGYPGPYRVRWELNGTRCYAFTPSDGINHFTLFDMISNEDWKGCVEARPPPYDVTDAAPATGTPATMFVPFFWMDTGGTAGQASSSSSSQPHYRNNNQSYLPDSNGDLRPINTYSASNWSNAPPSTRYIPFITTTSNGASGNSQEQREARFFNPFKYRGTAASLDTTPADTRGPNRGCPTPIVPLTTNAQLIQTNIAAMRDWMGGGTNQAEGLAWGWRVLSPSAPFTEGDPYGPDVRKVIVLMSDGVNTNVGTDAVMEGDYSAYNYLGFWQDHASGNALTQLLFGILHGVLPSQWRRNISNSGQYVTHVNARQAQLCTNIKAAGIEIYTVLFREDDEDTMEMMQDCASGDDHFIHAENPQQLQDAFDDIGTGIGRLRLTH
jgi:Flp pilus assembly protein TadG